MTRRTIADAFEEFDDNLKLDPAQRAADERMHNDITELLRRTGIIVYGFLQGSFARKTMIAPLRDVDKVVILASAMAALTPEQVMDAIQATIVAMYPDVAFDRSRHALKVDFGDESFYFDTVPSWETSTDDDDICIANRETGGWERSNTRELIRVVGERNKRTDGRFIHQVRMGKQAVRNLLDGIVPGLHVESWAYQVITEALAHDEACARILAAGARLLCAGYFDPTGVDLISARLKPSVIEQAKPVLERAAADALEARRLADAGQHEGAIRIWAAIFGECFPEPSNSDVSALRSSFLGGGPTARPIRPVRSWRGELSPT
jgi:hypothetical protein